MTNLLDYLATEFTSFEEAPLNAVDSAVLSQLCMIRAEGLIPELPQNDWLTRKRRTLLHVLPSTKKLDTPTRGVRLVELLKAECYEAMFTGPAKAETKEALLAAAASPRFREIRVSNYASVLDEETHTQFAAMTFTYKDDFAYVAFRGTDTSLVGWREDFNMSFSTPVPAQTQALAYLDAVVPFLPKRLYLGGHSKGANLAEYAALKTDARTQSRLERIFLHDGPGFRKEAFSPIDYQALEGKLHKTVPEEAIVGLLLYSHAPMRVVQSAEHGFHQHNLFNWEVSGRDFAYEEKLSEGSRISSDIVRSWVESYSDDERQDVVDAVFTAIELSGAVDALDLFSSPKRSLELLTEAARQTEGPLRDTITAAIRRAAEITAAHIGQNVGDFLPKPPKIGARDE